MLNIALGFLLIAHGLVHATLASAPNPSDADAKPGAFFTSKERSWLLSKLGLSSLAIRWIGIFLVIVSTLGFVLAGLGILGFAGLAAIWQTVSILSASTSIVLLILFWHRWLSIGLLIDVGILIALLWI